jgi:hypothetical protein
MALCMCFFWRVELCLIRPCNMQQGKKYSKIKEYKVGQRSGYQHAAHVVAVVLRQACSVLK